jgi:hypothetical protein
MIFENNNKVRKELYKTIEVLSDEQFNKKPSNGGWSPKQILEHLTLMETVIAKNISNELKNPSSPKAIKKPIAVSTNRIIKVEAPNYTVPTEDFRTKEEMKEQLHNSRLYLLDVYESGSKNDFLEKSFKHPIFGQIPLCQWFPFVGLHEKRHLKQLKWTIDEIS